MRSPARILLPVAGIAGLVLIAVGIVYLTVACENLPGFLGPTAGDTSPRIGLGVSALALGMVTLLVVYVGARRRPPGAPQSS